jgi:3-methylcrotonyl-CoA carboxylase alpha subunit
MPGRVARVNVNEGDVVEPHQVLVVLEAMKMEHAIETPAGGVVRELHCREGDLVAAGAPLLELGESA